MDITKKTKYELKCFETGTVLYGGWFSSLVDCIEHAIADKVDLSNIDLRNCNLSNANLDNAKMSGARFSGANLNGANMSEGVFDYADFSDCDLSSVCFAQSSLDHINFYGASFSQTDVTDATVTSSQFSCPSMFQVLWARTAAFYDCHYIHDNDDTCILSRPPIVIHGLARDIAFMDERVKIGHDIISKHDLIYKGRWYYASLYGEDITSHLLPIFEQKMTSV
jgi:hypothetical protein